MNATTDKIQIDVQIKDANERKKKIHRAHIFIIVPVLWEL